MAKEIRLNVATAGDKDVFGECDNYTLHADGMTVYFDQISDENSGFLFMNNGSDVAFVPESECDVSPIAAKDYAENDPNEKVRFAD